MTRYRSTQGGFINLDTGAFEPLVYRTYDACNPPPLPGIYTGDDTEPLVSMADGKHYTSRAAMRESYKAPNNPKGVDYIEVGNDPEFITPTPRQPLAPKKEDFLVAVEKAEAAINRGEFQDVP